MNKAMNKAKYVDRRTGRILSKQSWDIELSKHGETFLPKDFSELFWDSKKKIYLLKSETK